MDWSVLREPAAIPSLAASVLMVAIAVYLAYTDIASRPVRVFAAFLLLRAATSIVGVLGDYATDAPSATYWSAVGPYFSIAAAPAIVYFAALYPRPRSWLGRLPWGTAVVIGVTLVLELLYMADHTRFTDVSFDATGARIQGASGPLLPLGGLVHFGFGLVALVTAREYARTDSPPQRHAMLLVFVGFGLNALYDSAAALLVTGPNVPASDPWAVVNRLAHILAAVPAIAGAALVARVARSSPVPAVRSETRRALVALPAPVLSAVVLDLAGADPRGTPAAVVIGTWRLALALLVGYALVRHHLFGLDVRIRWGVRQGTVAGSFVAVFFVITEVAQQTFSKQVGPILGVLAAGLLLLALSPIQRMAERVAGAAMPHAHAHGHPGPDRSHREAAYRAAVELALMDGRLTRQEVAALHGVAEKLGLTPGEALRLRETVERDMASFRAGA